MKVPSRADCFKILKELEVPQNIVDHSIIVNRVAVFLADKLESSGVRVDKKAVDRASILHDMAKYESILHGGRHGNMAFEILRRKGYPGLGLLVKKHAISSVQDEKLKLRTWEEKVVYYSDKRAMRHKVVNLSERVAYLKKKCGANKRHLKKIEGAVSLMKKIEKEIFEKIRMKPQDLLKLNKKLKVRK